MDKHQDLLLCSQYSIKIVCFDYIMMYWSVIKDSMIVYKTLSTLKI